MRQGFLDAFRALVTAGADPTVRNRFGDAVTDYETGEEFGPEEVQAVVDAYLSRLNREGRELRDGSISGQSVGNTGSERGQ